jgi:hypothetical protein
MTKPTHGDAFVDLVFAVLELGRAVRENEAIVRLPAAMARHPALDPDTYLRTRAALTADVALGWRPLADLERLEREAGAVRLRDLAYLRQRVDLARDALPELRHRYYQATAQLLALMQSAARASRQQGASEDEIADAALTLGDFLAAHGAKRGVEPLV